MYFIIIRGLIESDQNAGDEGINHKVILSRMVTSTMLII